MTQISRLVRLSVNTAVYIAVTINDVADIVSRVVHQIVTITLKVCSPQTRSPLFIPMLFAHVER